jgi:iron complex outermembrane receptor protein
LRPAFAAALALGFALPPALQAQRPAVPDSVFELEPIEIRVLRSVVGAGAPAPVSVVTGKDLVRGRAGVFLEEALRAVVGLQIQNRFNLASGERLMIRGFGSRAQFGIRGVRVLVDGIPATLPDGQTAIDHIDIGGLGRAEILRGPSASLYGNAAGGVIHLSSVPPTLGSTASLQTTAGSHGLRALHGSASGAFGDGSYRFAVQRFSFDGFRRDPIADDGSTYGGAERTVANVLLRTTAAGGELRFTANALDMDARNPGSLAKDVLSEGNRPAYRRNVIQKTREVIRQAQAGVSWLGSMGGLDTELTAWGIHRELDGPIPPRVIELRRGAGGLRAILRRAAAIGDRRLSVGGGLELEIQSDGRRNWENDSGDMGQLLLDQQERVRADGVFLQARLDLSNVLGLSAGVRYDRFRFVAEDRLVSATDPDDSGERTMDAVSPSAGVVFEVVPDLETFASVSRSFETPTTTELVNRVEGPGGLNPALDPQKGTTLEGGVRARVAGLWSVEATLFRTRLTGELVPFEVPTDPGRTFFRNAGSSRHRGWEVAVGGTPTSGTSIRFAYTRVDARFTAFTVDGVDYAGRKIPGLAPFRVDGTLSVDHRHAFIIVRGLFEGDVPVDNANTESSDGYFLADLRVGLEDVTAGSLRFSPFAAITNIFDRRYTGAVVANARGGRFYEPGPPRSLQLGLGIRWGG